MLRSHIPVPTQIRLLYNRSDINYSLFQTYNTNGIKMRYTKNYTPPSKSYEFFIQLSSFILILTSLSPKAFCGETRVFPISTEFQIGKIKHMVERAPTGSYISVGSERSFRGACMAPHITHAYLIDVSPQIVRFNQINRELLKAPNREAYLHLRWEAPYGDWKKINPTLTKGDFKWWHNHVRDFGKMNYPLPEALNRYQSYPDAKRFIKMRDKITSLYQAWKNKETPTLSEKQFIESVTFEQLKDLGKKFSIPATITQEEWDWWTAYGKNKKLDCPKAWLENPDQAVDFGQVVDYKTGNYLWGCPR